VDRAKLAEEEKRVTATIQRNFSFVVFRVDDEEQRLRLESRIISTVSRCEACGPSPQWSGLHSPKRKTRESGLWLVGEFWKEPLSTEEFREVEAMVAGSTEK